MRHVFRYVVEDEPRAGEAVVLAESESHHLARVVRRRAGDEVEVIAPSGDLWPCRVVDPGPPAVLEVAGAPRPGPTVPPVHLRVGLCDASRLDLVAEKAAELGVLSLAVMVTARARRVPDARAWSRRAERMARVAEAAARQSGRGTWPAPGALVPFDHVLNETLACPVQQRLSRQAAGGVTGGNDGNRVHDGGECIAGRPGLARNTAHSRSRRAPPTGP